MSATTTQMTTAITNIEAALVALAAAHASYESGRAVAKSARATALGDARGEDIDQALSGQQLSRAIAGRMRSLGVETILHAGAAALGPQSADWVTTWSAQVENLVP